MNDIADILIALSGLFLIGLAAHWLGLKTRLPRVTLLILAGIAIGTSGIDLFSEYRSVWFPIVSDMAMVMLGFLIGGSLTLSVFRDQGKEIVSLSIGAVIGTFVLVLLGLLALQQSLPLAILLAAIATATDPAATSDVLIEARRQHTRFGKTLLGVVAIDDAWGLLLFSFCLVIAVGTDTGNGTQVMLDGAREVAGSVLLGLAIGLPMAFLTGRIRRGEPTLVEALGLVFLCGGLAMKFHLSHLLAAIVMGATVTNLARHHNRPFHAIEGIEWPFMVLFFILAGASLEMTALMIGGVISIAYMLLRIAGKVVGGWVTGVLLGRATEGRLAGFALLPQAGVAVAMALTASQAIPQVAEILLTIALASTVVFELIGPIATRWSVNQAEAPRTPLE